MSPHPTTVRNGEIDLSNSTKCYAYIQYSTIRTPADIPTIEDLINPSRSAYSQSPFWSTLDIIGDTSSEEAFPRVNSWLTCCLETTQTVKLQIQPSNPIEEKEPFLFEPTETTQPSPCIALRRRRASDVKDAPTTTKEKLECYRQAIEYASLPKTINDASSFSTA